MVQPVTDATFSKDVLESDQPVVVDFWAEWCGPCKQLSPILEAASANVSGVKVLKMNVDENVNAPTQFGIRGIPTLMAFKGGQPVATLVGLRSQGDVEAWLKSQA